MADMDPVVHFELPVEDRQRAMEFYANAFGWELNQLGKDMQNYVVAMTTETEAGPMGRPKKPGAINGGLYQKPDDPMGQHPSVVVAVKDIKTSMEKVKEAGGKVHGEPMDIPGVGKYASFTDTEGNRLSILQPSGM